MKPSKKRKKHKPIINVITMGAEFKPGRVYGVSWFSQGEVGFNDMCFIPLDTKNAEKYFYDWLYQLARFIESINIDIHVKELPLK